MESDGDDIENIFEEYENNENVDEVENTENKTANETPEAVKIAAPKRIVKNPRLKFNADRLCGERGIPVLVDHFKNVKFKGPGHEKEDLDKLLARLEHWTHRLFPSMKFEDCLTHIEKLGKKRPVQTCLRKIRLDMPILSSDFVKDNEADDVKRNEDAEPAEISAFDRLLGQSQDTSDIDVSAVENASYSNIFPSSPMPNDNSAHVLGSSFGSSLTDEQKERMERNRMLAAERRKAKLAAMERNSEGSQSESNEASLSESAIKQNSFDKLLDSSECNEENIENNKFGLETNHDFDESLNKSSDFNNDISEKLGLDDLMNLVDEEDSVSNENVVASLSEQTKTVSGNVGNTSYSPSCAAQILKNFNSISKNTENNVVSEKPSEENLNMESSLNLICETFVDSNTNVNTECSVKNTLDINSIIEPKDFNSMDCENENSRDDCYNISEINKFPFNDAEDGNNIDDVPENSKNKIISSPSNLEKSQEKNINMKSSLNLVSKNFVDSELNVNAGYLMKNTSVTNGNAATRNEDLTFMDCEDENDVPENIKNKNIALASNSKKFQEENLNMESSLNLVSESFGDSDLNAGCLEKSTSVTDGNAVTENEDLTSMNCEDKNF